ncbi:hypothetical protein JQ629_09105 [Bradyrhizobium sp. AUGA SZCCT0222]|uniref:hypothetical protein n=1 Tax=Bradyrhizobium sp. AUGA SZCCT0222 TaxID=2807668 RepID=UPI001BA734E9|nr:hypothetical protein [Bradyrhizobium sp. AUGA SZCCT0222]MBR1267664.1 hypothetical protein [Bradyrhizobium sp. AUGA SZCCT0222]
MTETKHDDRAGPRAPKKRKKGNSRKDRARNKPDESQLSVIERLLRAPVAAVKDGQPERMPALQAIMFQLVQRSLAGDKKAERTRQKFEEFAKRNSAAELEVVFVDNDYTTAFAASGEVDNV